MNTAAAPWFVIHSLLRYVPAMIQRKVISVSLTPELDAYVRGLVGTEGYGSSSEVVRAGLRLLQGQGTGSQDRPHAPAASLRREDG